MIGCRCAVPGLLQGGLPTTPCCALVCVDASHISHANPAVGPAATKSLHHVSMLRVHQIKADIPGQSADRINVAADGTILRIGVVRCFPTSPKRTISPASLQPGHADVSARPPAARHRHLAGHRRCQACVFMSVSVRLWAGVRLMHSADSETPSFPQHDRHAVRRTARSPRKTTSRRLTSAANARQGG